MCGRYSSFLPAEAMRRTFRAVNPLLNLEPSWNVTPTQMAPVVRQHPETGDRHLDLLKWGCCHTSPRIRFVHDGRSTAGRRLSPRLAGSVVPSSCAVPADGFINGRRSTGQQPYAAAPQAQGLRRIVGRLRRMARSCTTIITTDASPDVAELHNRMPVILEPGWIGETPDDPKSPLQPPPIHQSRVT